MQNLIYFSIYLGMDFFMIKREKRSGFYSVGAGAWGTDTHGFSQYRGADSRELCRNNRGYSG